MEPNVKTIDLSVIIPTHNEINNVFFKETLGLLNQYPNIETICVDNDSRDGTKEFVLEKNIVFYSINEKLRSKRFNFGFKKSCGQLILFHHPRSLLSSQAIDYLLKNRENLVWGGFRHAFDQKHRGLQLTSWYSNNVRPRTQGIVYLDHCLFAQRVLLLKLTEPLWPETAIFEDSDFCRKLYKFHKPLILPFASVTSSIRFQKNGFFKQVLLNQILKIGYFAGFDRESMNKWYERRLFLNSK